MAHLAVPTAVAPVEGRFRVPPSKSIQQRYLALAALADGPSELVADGAPSQDAALFAQALGRLSGRAASPQGRVEGGWTGASLGASRASVRADLGMNGTGFRLAIALAGLRPPGARTLVTGAPRLRSRPHAPLLRALGRLGAHVVRRTSGAVRVRGAAWSRHEVALPADVSSQFATALLLAAPRAGGLVLTLVGHAVSDAYLGLTASALAAFDLPVRHEGARWEVPAGVPRAGRRRIEADASSAAPWWAAAARTGGRVVVEGIPAATAQPDAALLGILERMGARVRGEGPHDVEVVGPGGRLRAAGDVDLRATPDLAPVVAALAADAVGETRVVGAPHLRWKESDRVASVVAAVRAVGGEAEAREDGFVVRGRPLPGGLVRVAGDHRIALAFGVLGLWVPGVALDGGEAVGKSYPGFLEDLRRAAGAAPSPGRPPA